MHKLQNIFDTTIQDYILNYIFLFLILEIYEIYWQKATTLMGMLAKMHYYYAKNIFLFFLMHPTFYFAIGFAILSNYAVAAIIILLVKTADIITKILLLNQVFIKKELTHELSIILLTPLHPMLPYLGLFIYPVLIYFTF